MLLMVEKGVRGKICHAIYWCAKANYKYMKDYDKNTESSYLKDWNVNNLYGWTMPQKLPLGGFKWVENSSQVSKHFATMKIVRKDIFFNLMFNIWKNYMALKMVYSFCLKKWKLEKLKKVQPTCTIQKNCYKHKNFKTSIKSWISIEKSA